MNWDDVRIAIAVHQGGSYAAAAARLHIDETTVARRIARLQTDLGFALFEAADGVRRPTVLGSEMLRRAVQMAGVAREIAGLVDTTGHPATTIRIATTDSIAVEMLGPRVADLLIQHPGLTIEFLASTDNVNFSRWEADLAVRLMKPKKGDFIVSKIAELSFDYLAPKQIGADNALPLVCAYPDTLDAAPEAQFLKAEGLKENARCVTKNLLVVKSLIESGKCAGVLPTFMSREILNDDRYQATRLPATRDVWLLVQPHLKGDPVARTVIDWIKRVFQTA